ncbi:leucine-rich repeat transmembrane protein kinase protein, partial [Tanacetum coccineum]
MEIATTVYFIWNERNQRILSKLKEQSMFAKWYSGKHKTATYELKSEEIWHILYHKEGLSSSILYANWENVATIGYCLDCDSGNVVKKFCSLFDDAFLQEPLCVLVWATDTIYPDPYTHIDPPSEVMNAAAEPLFSDSIELRWYPVNASDKFLIYLHFAETRILKGNHNRVFNIYLNRNYWNGPIYPQNRTTTTVYRGEPETAAPSYTLTINRTKKSKLPPIINALELYTLKPPPQRQTDDHDGK